jgi:hypothetical protein
MIAGWVFQVSAVLFCGEFRIPCCSWLVPYSPCNFSLHPYCVITISFALDLGAVICPVMILSLGCFLCNEEIPAAGCATLATAYSFT